MYTKSMKISKTDYERLSGLIAICMIMNDIKDRSNNVTVTRYAWDIFNATMDMAQLENRKDDYDFLRNLYDYLSDNHIETALKKILKFHL